MGYSDTLVRAAEEQARQNRVLKMMEMEEKLRRQAWEPAREETVQARPGLTKRVTTKHPWLGGQLEPVLKGLEKWSPERFGPQAETKRTIPAGSAWMQAQALKDLALEQAKAMADLQTEKEEKQFQLDLAHQEELRRMLERLTQEFWPQELKRRQQLAAIQPRDLSPIYLMGLRDFYAQLRELREQQRKEEEEVRKAKAAALAQIDDELVKLETEAIALGETNMSADQKDDYLRKKFAPILSRYVKDPELHGYAKEEFNKIIGKYVYSQEPTQSEPGFLDTAIKYYFGGSPAAPPPRESELPDLPPVWKRAKW